MKSVAHSKDLLFFRLQFFLLTSAEKVVVVNSNFFFKENFIYICIQYGHCIIDIKYTETCGDSRSAVIYA